MKKVDVFASMIFGLVGVAYATAASADDFMATKAVPAATTKAPATCGSLEDLVVTDCPLTWHGITLYGVDRRGRDVDEPWGALQRDIRRRGRLSYPEVQQPRAVESRAKRLDPVKHRDQGEGTARCGMDFYLRSAGRVRSLFPATRQWTEVGD